MYYDQRLELCRNQNFGGAGPLGAALTNSVNVIDLKVNRDIAEGQNLYVRCVVTEAFTVGAGTPRMIIGLLYADNAALSSNVYMPIAACGGTPLLLGATDNIASPAGYLAAALTLNKEILIPIPPQQYVVQRYLGLAFIQAEWATAYYSAGKLTAHVTHDPYQHTLYPDAI